MKLAEALSLRADLQRRIAQLRGRLEVNAKVQEGDIPAEDPKELLNELDRNIIQLEGLIRRINNTNCKTIVDELSLTDMIARKDTLSLKNSILREFFMQASDKVDRYSNKEIKIYSTINVKELQKTINSVSKELREIDVKIQGLNWMTDLI